ncbi:syntaxin binding protein 1 [Mycoemilia scoparia]|uniref:Syntaxin binding protein 1 n=1 Tax=Mycoemilia scoparia TaxID=417184 RepID=A0A9W8DRV5_9FUNG|nr:syntaxin binding protein 1 [Mycoemilia scoparia]
MANDKEDEGISIPRLRRQDILNGFKSLRYETKYKALVLDHRSAHILAENLNTRNLDKLNIKKPYLQIKSAKEYQDIDAIYFLTPSFESVNDLIKDFSVDPTTTASGNPHGKYFRSAYVFFTSAVSLGLLKYLGRNEQVSRNIRAVMQLQVEFETFEQKVFITRLGNCPMYRMYSPHMASSSSSSTAISRGNNNGDGGFKNVELQFISKKIANFFELLKVLPSVRYFAPDKSVVPACRAHRLSQFVADELEERRKVTTSVLNSPKAKEYQSELIIVDRSVDPLAPVLHEFTYQAMVYDLLDINDENEFIYMNHDGKARKNKIKYHDPIWKKYGKLHICDAHPLITKEFNKFMDDNPELVDFEAGKRRGGRQLQKLVNKIEELHSKKRLFSLHVSLVQTCLKMYKKLKLNEIARIEQNLVMGETGSFEPYTKETALEDIRKTLSHLRQLKPATVKAIRKSMKKLDKIPSTKDQNFVTLVRHIKLEILDLVTINQNAIRLLMIYMLVHQVPQEKIMELIYEYEFDVDNLKIFDIRGFIKRLKEKRKAGKHPDGNGGEVSSSDESMISLQGGALKLKDPGSVSKEQLIIELKAIKKLIDINGLMALRNLKFMMRRSYISQVLYEIRNNKNNNDGDQGGSAFTFSNIVSLFTESDDDDDDGNEDGEVVYELSRYKPSIKSILHHSLLGKLNAQLFPPMEPSSERYSESSSRSSNSHNSSGDNTNVNEDIKSPPSSVVGSFMSMISGKTPASEFFQTLTTPTTANSTTNAAAAANTTTTDQSKTNSGGGGGGLISWFSTVSGSTSASPDPKESSDTTAPKEIPKSHPRVILFVIGGITMSEVRTAYELRKQHNCEVLVGSTHILTPSRYLNELAILRDNPVVLGGRQVNMSNSCYQLGYGAPAGIVFDPITPYLPKNVIPRSVIMSRAQNMRNRPSL